MFGLPKSTEYGRRIPKQKFYENITVTPALKKAFSEQIKAIYWRNKIASSTVNIARGETVTEIEIFEIKLNAAQLDENVLRRIDAAVPYHILFILEHDGRYKTAFLKVGDTKIELLEPTSPESTIAKFIENKGAGVHHVAFAIEDGVANALAEVEAAGVRLIDKAPRKGAEGLNIAFLHPKSTLGVLTELCEKPE